MYTKAVGRGNALLRERAPLSSPDSRRHAVHGNLRSQQRRICICHSEDTETQDLQTLPIFPLGMVALPSADVPLNIFEAKYRVLFHTLIAEGKGIEPELVQEESPFKGTKRFGLCFICKQGLSKYGTLLEITKHSVQKNGTLLILNKGLKRFRLEKIKQEKPVLVCDVTMLEDDCDEESLKESAEKAKELFTNVVKLNARHRKVAVNEEHSNPPELQELTPSQLPYWIASLFSNTPESQQKLLEMDSPEERLDYVISVLDESYKHTSAALAIDSVFAAPSAEESVTPDGEAGVQGKSEGDSGESKGSE